MAFICPQSTVDKLEKEKMPRKGGRWWFSWRRRDFPAEEVSDHGQGGGRHRVEARFTRCMFSHSAVPRRRKAQPGSSRGEMDLLAGTLQLELSLGTIPVGAAVAPAALRQ